MTGKEAVQFMGCSRTLLHYYRKQGKIHATLNGQRYDYSRQDIEKLVMGKKPIDRISIQALIDVLGYDLTALRGSVKTRELANQRRIIAYILNKNGMSSYEIGFLLNKNQSSVSAMINTSYLVEHEIRSAENKWRIVLQTTA